MIGKNVNNHLISIIIVLAASPYNLFAQISFNNFATEVGINVVCGNTYLGNGISFYDYDNDGWDDITIASADGDPIRFLKNINGSFVEQTLNIDQNNWQNRQVNWVDIDNDGDNDLFVTSDDTHVRLYENIGNMIMNDITNTSGMLIETFYVYGASWGDYNNDGFLDVFLSIRDYDTPNILYKNNGDNTFTLANAEAGLLSEGMLSFCSAFLDYNNDGYQDIYVSNDKPNTHNLLYKNNGDGTFTEVSQISGSDVYIDAMSVTVDDINSDGWLDIYITNDDSDSVLLLNNGDETFTDIAVSAQVTFNSLGWGAVFIDADNDKDLDLYVSGETNGTVPGYLSSAFYINNNDGTYSISNSSVPNDYASSFSNAIGDTDNDGYPEIVVNNINHDNIFLWKNNTEPNNNWLKVKLEGTQSNRNGIGSFIEISINGEKQYRYTLCGEGYLSQNSATESFGLGTAEVVDYVKVKWLSGIEDVIYNVSSNQLLNITEGSNTLSMGEFETQNSLLYYPNPVENTLTLTAQNAIENIVLYNMLGQEVHRTTPNNVESILDMSTLQEGTYYIRVIIADITETVRVIKQ
ncbi:FG-GAP-like repeat-containing protein [Winogradskyella ouciana]|uniref:T9SS type A sorting domain-containing protein n=1 Tax=Winogradskyella ouciana TaxID=2608631 RepID=A0A7K1G7T7_9FLAO|nr:FG-GAP-like repeat-containing protein [Winogradskyella ouciana]MTE25346.1 T9SS type A sorting domain-containing protein [Winogradskyella ouciana]